MFPSSDDNEKRDLNDGGCWLLRSLHKTVKYLSPVYLLRSKL